MSTANLSCVKPLCTDLSLLQPNQPVLALPLGSQSDYDYHLMNENAIFPVISITDCNRQFLLYVMSMLFS